jgi:hypothetical protein
VDERVRFISALIELDDDVSLAIDLIVEARKEHPFRGPRKLRALPSAHDHGRNEQFSPEVRGSRAAAGWDRTAIADSAQFSKLRSYDSILVGVLGAACRPREFLQH